MSESAEHDPAQPPSPDENLISVPALRRIRGFGVAGVGAGVVLEGVAAATGEPGIAWIGLVLIEGGGSAALGSHVALTEPEH